MNPEKNKPIASDGIELLNKCLTLNEHIACRFWNGCAAVVKIVLAMMVCNKDVTETPASEQMR